MMKVYTLFSIFATFGTNAFEIEDWYVVVFFITYTIMSYYTSKYVPRHSKIDFHRSLSYVTSIYGSKHLKKLIFITSLNYDPNNRPSLISPVGRFVLGQNDVMLKFEGVTGLDSIRGVALLAGILIIMMMSRPRVIVCCEFENFFFSFTYSEYPPISLTQSTHLYHYNI